VRREAGVIVRKIGIEKIKKNLYPKIPHAIPLPVGVPRAKNFKKISGKLLRHLKISACPISQDHAQTLQTQEKMNHRWT
jgi:hypothetical protein